MALFSTFRFLVWCFEAKLVMCKVSHFEGRKKYFVGWSVGSLRLLWIPVFYNFYECWHRHANGGVNWLAFDRYMQSRLRAHAESIAFFGGGAREQAVRSSWAPLPCCLFAYATKSTSAPFVWWKIFSCMQVLQRWKVDSAGHRRTLQGASGSLSFVVEEAVAAWYRWWVYH